MKFPQELSLNNVCAWMKEYISVDIPRDEVCVALFPLARMDGNHSTVDGKPLHEIGAEFAFIDTTDIWLAEMIKFYADLLASETPQSFQYRQLRFSEIAVEAAEEQLRFFMDVRKKFYAVISDKSNDRHS